MVDKVVPSCMSGPMEMGGSTKPFKSENVMFSLAVTAALIGRSGLKPILLWMSAVIGGRAARAASCKAGMGRGGRLANTDSFADMLVFIMQDEAGPNAPAVSESANITGGIVAK